jgi:flagellar hook-basal body complex protein FliE
MIKNIETLSPISLQNDIADKQSKTGKTDFFQILQESLNEVNTNQVKGDRALSDIATGQVKDLHSAAMAISKAELSMKMMLEVRNKALNAYKEILKTPI